MQHNINSYRGKIKIEKNRISKLKENTSKVNIFDSTNFNVSKKSNEYIKKKRKRFLNDKKAYFKVENNSKLYKKESSHDSIYNNEIWTKNEKNKFSKENILSGINWKKTKELIPTRTMAQVKSFAKNFFYKIKSCKDDNLQIDLSLNSKNTLKDMIEHINSKYPDIQTIILILKKLLNKTIKIRKFKTFHKKNIQNRKINNQKNEFILIEAEKNHHANNYIFSNRNSLNDFENNMLFLSGNDNVNKAPSNKNKYNIFNINFIRNNVINNNIIIPKIILNDSITNLENFLNMEKLLLNYYLKLNIININIGNFLLIDNILNLKNILLNHYLDLNIVNDLFINYLYQINNLFFNVLNGLNSFNAIPLINKSFSFMNNNNN